MKSFSFGLELPVRRVFWRHLCHFGRIKIKKISSFNSTNFFYVCVGWMDKMNFWHPIFSGFGSPILGCWHLVHGLWTQKALLQSIYAIHQYYWFAVNFFLQAVGILQVFLSGSAHVRNFRNVSLQHSPLPRHLWICHRDYEDHGDSLYGVADKTGSFSPMHRSESNWTHKCIPCNKRSLPYFTWIGLHLGEMAADKLVFVL